MAAPIHGRLGAIDLAATTLTAAYVVPASRQATVDLVVCNRGASDVTVRVAHIDAAVVGSVANEDYLAYGATVPAGGYLSFGGIPMRAQHTLAVYSSATSVNAVVQCIEEDA
jgi:hypothetical protein